MLLNDFTDVLLQDAEGTELDLLGSLRGEGLLFVVLEHCIWEILRSVAL